MPRPAMHSPFWRRLAWFVLLWAAGLGALSVVAYGIRLMLGV
ncbi:DUF2474 family protein [Halodurantibacterium flavum]|uniref:DUF2474 family protein n=1 Tax=Halodurantibacterium flavum TaxID=1382802 RepID=A0ABW4S5M5_9RHOB